MQEYRKSPFGKLYNWYAVNDPRGLAPEGFHIPSSSEWEILINYLGGYKVAGRKMKKNGLKSSEINCTDATNSSGFTALMSGYRDNNDIQYLGSTGYWWTSENDISNIGCYLRCDISAAYINYDFLRTDGLSVRCIKD